MGAGGRGTPEMGLQTPGLWEPLKGFGGAGRLSFRDQTAFIFFGCLHQDTSFFDISCPETFEPYSFLLIVCCALGKFFFFSKSLLFLSAERKRTGEGG